MGIVERKMRHKEEIRTGILGAAWHMVVTDGWQSLSIRKIADAIEYSIPVIYNHFENKEAILLEFSKEGYQKLALALQEAKKIGGFTSRSARSDGNCLLGFCF